MRIIDSMLVGASVADNQADVRPCAQCGTQSFHVPQSVLVMSASGARRMRLWVCEQHPLPEHVTDVA
jgi:hypothetical protein